MGSVFATAPVQIQLYTLEENSIRVDEFPFGKKYIIALVSETDDLTNALNSVDFPTLGRPTIPIFTELIRTYSTFCVLSCRCIGERVVSSLEVFY